jgi:hypothetical protein
MADPKLKLGNDIWATKQKSLLAYNDEGGNFKSLPFQVDRISSGTYVGRNGLIQTAASNEPRIDFLSNTKGHLLLEPQRTNYAAYSAQFDNSYWSKATSDSTPNPTVTANAAVSPDGGLNADRVQATAAPSNQWAVVKRDGINTGATVGSKLQQSIYLKAYDSSQVGKNVDVYMFDWSNTVYKTMYKHTLTSDWERVVVEHTITGANTTTNIQFAFGKGRDYEGGSTQSEAATDFLVWGGQLEKGDTKSSYIPTSGGAVTRVVDSCLNAGNSNIFNNTEGVLFGQISRLGTPSSGEWWLISVNDNSGSNVIAIGFNQSNGNLYGRLKAANATQFENTSTSSTIGQSYKLAVRYSGTEAAFFIDGVKKQTISNPTSFTGTLKRLDFSFGGGTSPFYGKNFQLMYFDESLSDAELIELTS